MSAECPNSLVVEPEWRCPESRNGNHFCTLVVTHRCLHECPCGVKWTDDLIAYRAQVSSSGLSGQVPTEEPR